MIVQLNLSLLPLPAIMNIENGQVWMALALVSPTEKNGPNGFAFKVLHYAASKAQFKEVVAQQLLQYGYILKDLQDISLFNFDEAHNDNLDNLAVVTRATRCMQWGTFHSFDY